MTHPTKKFKHKFDCRFYIVLSRFIIGISWDFSVPILWDIRIHFGFFNFEFGQTIADFDE